ncbi:MAG TPA: hypothetical protein DIS66_01375 [Candidatus Omnitrophica bacterium]|nr:hypothetical protein [Candidatus Omnitrophota bacterium]
MESLIGIRIPLTRLRAGLLCFRFKSQDDRFVSSVREQGLLQPLTVAAHGKNYVVIDGHKRLAVLKKLKMKTAPCFVIEKTAAPERLLAALALNQGSRFMDTEIGLILNRAVSEFGFSEDVVVKKIMPLVGLTPSVKVLRQYQAVAALPKNIFDLVCSGQLPFHGAAGLAQFKTEDKDYLAANVLKKIKPSASQMAHLCEWWLDLTQIKKEPVRLLLQKSKVFPQIKQADVRMRTDLYYKAIRALRFPALVSREAAFRDTVKAILKGDSSLELRAPENFEQEGLFLQAHIRSLKGVEQVEKAIINLKKQAPALFDTLL